MNMTFVFLFICFILAYIKVNALKLNQNEQNFYTQLFSNYVRLTYLLKDEKDIAVRDLMFLLRENCEYFLSEIDPNLSIKEERYDNIPVIMDSMRMKLDMYLTKEYIDIIASKCYQNLNMFSRFFTRLDIGDYLNIIRRSYEEAFPMKKSEHSVPKDKKLPSSSNTKYDTKLPSSSNTKYDAIEKVVLTEKLRQYYSALPTFCSQVSTLPKPYRYQANTKLFFLLHETCQFYYSKLSSYSNSLIIGTMVPMIPNTLKLHGDEIFVSNDFSSILRNALDTLHKNSSEKQAYKLLINDFAQAYRQFSRGPPSFYDYTNSETEILSESMRHYYMSLPTICSKTNQLLKSNYYYGNPMLNVLLDTCNFYSTKLRPYLNTLFVGTLVPTMPYLLKIQSKDAFDPNAFSLKLKNALDYTIYDRSQNEAYKLLITEIALIYRNIQ